MNKHLILMIMLLFSSFCSNKDDNNNNYKLNILGLFLIDQLSGNCVVIGKDIINNVYTAKGYIVSKGGCNASSLDTNLYTTSVSESKELGDIYYDAIKAEYDKSLSCSSRSTEIARLKAEYTLNALTTAKNNLVSGACTFGGVRIINGKVGFILLCKDDSAIASIKARIQYLNVNSVMTDMATKLNDLKLSISNGNSQYGFSSLAIEKIRPLNLSEYDIFNSLAYWTYSATANPPDCAKAILSNNPSIKPFLAATSGKLLTSQADANSITEVITNSLTCKYGTGFTEVTTPATSTTSTVEQKCPSSYPTF